MQQDLIDARKAQERDSCVKFFKGNEAAQVWMSVVSYPDKSVRAIRYFRGGGKIHASIDYDGPHIAVAYHTLLAILIDLF